MIVDFKLTKQVKKKRKKFTKVLSVSMVVLAIIMVLMGIIFESGFFLPAMLILILYYFYSINSDREYEYNFETNMFTVDVIRGKRKRKTEQALYYENIEVVCPPDHELVQKYKKNGGTEKLKKYDYTSYREDVPYYTMIVQRNDEKIKVLLDLDEEVLRFLKLRYPTKVFLQ